MKKQTTTTSEIKKDKDEKSDVSSRISLIIEEESLLRWPQKLTAISLTMLFWGIMAYLWQPIISMAAWAFEIKLFYNHMIILGGYHAFVEMIIDYSIVIAIMAAALLGWARLQRWRFRGKEKRQQMAPTNDQELSQYFRVDQDQLNEWRQWDNIHVTLDDQGYPQHLQQHLSGDIADDIHSSIFNNQ